MEELGVIRQKGARAPAWELWGKPRVVGRTRNGGKAKEREGGRSAVARRARGRQRGTTGPRTLRPFVRTAVGGNRKYGEDGDSGRRGGIWGTSRHHGNGGGPRESDVIAGK